MGISDKVWDALTGAIKLTDRVETLSRQVSALAGEVRQGAGDLREMDRRLVRIETLLEVALAAKGALIASKPSLPSKRGGA